MLKGLAVPLSMLHIVQCECSRASFEISRVTKIIEFLSLWQGIITVRCWYIFDVNEKASLSSFGLLIKIRFEQIRALRLRCQAADR